MSAIPGLGLQQVDSIMVKNRVQPGRSCVRHTIAGWLPKLTHIELIISSLFSQNDITHLRGHFPLRMELGRAYKA